MSDRKKLNLEEEVKLSFQVRKFPCLFDKMDKGFKEKDCIANSWKAVADSLEFLNDGNAAKYAFEKLRKRYNKKNNDVKKMNKSGKSIREVQKAERALEEYTFLSWLDNFIYKREGRTDVIQKDTSVGDEDTYFSKRDPREEESEKEEYEESDIDDSTQSFDDLSLNSQSVITSPEPLNNLNTRGDEISRKRNCREVSKPNFSKSAKRAKTNKSEYVDDMGLTLIRDLGNAVKSGAKEKPLDDVDTYVKSLAVDLRRLSQRDYFMAKHEIQSIVFKYQMAQYCQPPNQVRPSREMHLHPMKKNGLGHMKVG